MERAPIIVAGVATVAGAYLVLRWLQGQQGGGAPAISFSADGLDNTSSDPTAPTITESLMDTVRATLQYWRPPAAYAAMIASAEDQFNIPRDILARLLYQESHYRTDIITGRTKSPVGALGIAQFMPATAADLGIDPLDPAQAIPAAARYLAGLYNRFGSWSQALAAYNWGQGNVARKGLANAPTETQHYYTDILGDVNTANGTAYA